MEYTFGEKTTEYHKQYGDIPVWQSPKYIEAKKKAVEAIESGKYGLTEADFWILKNATKTKKMAYTGLIISHNGCLKINDTLESKFNPSCVTIDKDGYKDELAFIYCNEEQGIFEVGEVSTNNCQNDYPYAMALKRCFDRVVLKLSKLAYGGIYSDSESDEFVQRQEDITDQLPQKTDVEKQREINIKISAVASARGVDEETVKNGIKEKLGDTPTADQQINLLTKWLLTLAEDNKKAGKK